MRTKKATRFFAGSLNFFYASYIRGNLSGISSSDYLEARADVIVIVVIANSNSNDTADNSEAKQRTAEQSAATAESATESAAATE